MGVDAGPSHERFNDLLLRYSQELGADARERIDETLWSEYGATVSPLVVDMSGFTRLTDSHGLVHYLSMVRRMQLTAEPIIRSFEGTLVRFEADNAYAHFESPGNAVRAAIALNLALDSANLLTPEELDVRVSCGIDHGKCLIPHTADFFGSPVNRASKLGEDIAKAGQILITRRAFAMIPEALGLRSEARELVIGGRKQVVREVFCR